ncbi:MAG: hypothetical protein ACFFDT_21200 [Candidatus Hodarchaeota archaeon]
MATTLASTLGSNIILEGEDHAIIERGKLASTYSPGDWVYKTAAGTWTHIDSDGAAASQVVKPALVGYKERILSTGAQSTIDTAYTTSDIVPIIKGFKMGTGRVIGKIADPGAAVYANNKWVVSATAGVLELGNATDYGAGMVEADVFNDIDVGNGDTYTIFQMR